MQQNWLQKLLSILVDSPGLLANVVVAVATLLAAFGLVISGEEVEAIVATIFSISTILAGIQGRRQTVPIHRVKEYVVKDGSGTMKARK